MNEQILVFPHHYDICLSFAFNMAYSMVMYEGDLPSEYLFPFFKSKTMASSKKQSLSVAEGDDDLAAEVKEEEEAINIEEEEFEKNFGIPHHELSKKKVVSQSIPMLFSGRYTRLLKVLTMKLITIEKKALAAMTL
jgi:hypothetical protein